MNPSMEQSGFKHQAEYVEPVYRRCGCRIDDSEQTCQCHDFSNLEVMDDRELTPMEQRVDKYVQIIALVVVIALVTLVAFLA